MPEADFTLKSKRPNYLKIIVSMKIFFVEEGIDWLIFASYGM